MNRIWIVLLALLWAGVAATAKPNLPPSSSLAVLSVMSAWTGLSPNSFTPVNAANFDGGNRLLIQSSAYDAAGQQTAIGGYTFSYDAEGHVTSSTLAGVTTTYTYDGDGRRITKSTGSSAITYVYDAAGQLAAEYGGTAPATTTQYLTSDHLGSTRVVTSGAQAVVRRYDYFPFGEALRAGAGGRTDVGGYEPTEEPQKLSLRFTGKERDAESGLDFFGARYFSGAQGRFTSPDAPFADQHTIDPQSWNLYAYVRNNPLKNTDPNGRDCFQGVVSCANYVLGGVGAVTNAFTSGLVNLPNRLADGLAAPFNGGQRVFGDLVPDAFTPTNIDQRQGMEAANAVMLLSPLAELGAARAVSVTAAEVPLVTRNAARGAASEGRVLNDMGLTKNTTPITGTAGRSIPDINTSTVVGDIKDVKVVSNTSQMKIQREVAGQTGREHVIVTGTNTHVTKPTQQPPTRIIRRDDLGPPQ